MRKTNCRIGFNDGMLMVIGIPLLSFIIPIVFFNCRFNRSPFLTWDKYFTTMMITTVIWLGNRYIMIYSRKKYSIFDEVRKRIIFQSLLMFIFTVTANTVVGIFTKEIFADEHAAYFSETDILIHSNSAALFCTIMIIAIYESIYFMHELRHSVEETEKLKRENLAAQLNALRSQVNPHFLFNNLNTLSSLIPESPDHAVDFVQQLSKVYRHILEVKDEKSISLKDELEVLNAYTFLLKTRFDKNLQVNINIPQEKLQKKIVPLSLQILMENAIKHNIVSSDKPLHIDVFTENGSLVISNNLQMKNQVNESTGIGLENIRNRYKLLSDAPVKVTENETNFTVSIPLIDN
ncbi:sensor histidine kinase [Ferruginibacter sp. SUN106]|uniref:sensor histidine kinase n=1 Tax=Ferruginibacter sp. SUN106 TaxID=2978348 RepID=UPI003D368F19